MSVQVFVAGCTGNVGSRAVRELLAQGFKVSCCPLFLHCGDCVPPLSPCVSYLLCVGALPFSLPPFPPPPPHPPLPLFPLSPCL